MQEFKEKQSCTISITHFINPQLFWYKKQDFPNEEFTKVQNQEAHIAEHFKKHGRIAPNHRLHPVVGDVVALKYFLFNKYIRARVLFIYKNEIGRCTDLIVWALDYGFPISTKLEHLYSLPAELSQPNDFIRCGGLAFVKPAEKEYDFLQNIFEMKEKNKWGSLACERFKELIDNSKSLRFINCGYTRSKNQYWGDIEITTSGGFTIMGINFLIKMDVALCETDKHVFRKICESEKITGLDQWKSHDGKAYYEKNITKSINIEDDIPTDSVLAKRSYLKVEEWKKRNCQDVEGNEGPRNSRLDYSPSFDDDMLFQNFPVPYTSRNANSSCSKIESIQEILDQTEPVSSEFNVNFSTKSSIKAEQPSGPRESCTERRIKLFEKLKSRCCDTNSQSTGDEEWQPKAHEENKEEIFSDVSQPALSWKMQKFKNLSKNRDRKLVDNSKDNNSKKVCEKTWDSEFEVKSSPEQAFELNKKHFVDKSFKKNSLDTYDSNQKLSTQKCSETRKFSQNDYYEYKPIGYNSDQSTLSKQDANSNSDTSQSSKNNWLKAKFKRNMNIKQNVFKNAESSAQHNIQGSSNPSAVNFENQSISKTAQKGVDATQNTLKAEKPLNILPAGFDVTRNYPYNDEENHWHRKKTTRDNIKIKGDRSSATEPNFQFTRPHTDKHKNTTSEEDPTNKKPDKEILIIGESIAELRKVDESNEGVTRDPQPIIERNQKTHTKYLENLVLAHSEAGEEVSSCEKLSEIGWSDYTCSAMLRTNMKKVYRIQSYAWPHIAKSKSAFIINPSSCGKTVSYMPPICEILFNYKVVNLSKNGSEAASGPIILILSPDSKQAEKVSRYLRRFLVNMKGSAVELVTLLGQRKVQETKIQLINGCDILVTTPPSFLRLIKDNESEPLLDGKRLRHYVVDDVDLLWNQSQKDFDAVFKEIFKLSKQSGRLPHLVVTSREWNPNIERLVPQSMKPLVLIGDFLEAAVYGKTNINLKFCATIEKSREVLKFIRASPVEMKTLIICDNDDDTQDLENTLNMNGLKCISFYSHSSITERVKEWKLKKSKDVILICNEYSYKDLEISDAQCLIHYSLPSSWTMFTQRFVVFKDLHENFIRKAEKSKMAITEAKKRYKTVSLVLLNENNDLQLPTFVDFLKRHNKDAGISPTILKVSKNSEIRKEEQRCRDLIPLCPKLLEFGECMQRRICKYRHVIIADEKDTQKYCIPTSGSVKMTVLKVFSPTHFTVRLMEHKPQDSTKFEIIRQSNEAQMFDFELKVHYGNPDNLFRLVGPIKQNDIFIFKEEETFYRAIVVHKAGSEIDIKLIDAGEIRNNVSYSDLYICDDQFKSFPRQAIEMRVLNIVPVDQERSWDEDTTNEIRKFFTLGEYECFCANITFAMAECIWVKNVSLMRYLTSCAQYVYPENLKRFIIKRHYGCENAIVFERIQTLLESCEGFKHLETLENPLSANEGIQKATGSSDDRSSENEDSTSLTEGNSVKISNTMPHTEGNTLKNTLETLSKSQTQKTSQCKMPENAKKILEKWSTLPLQELIQVDLGEESANGNWSNLFLKRADDDYLSLFEILKNKIKSHITNQEKLTDVEIIDIDRIRPLDNFLVKFNGLYSRAKLLAIYGTNKLDRIYRFYLCDEGAFVKLHVSLLQEHVCQTNDDIVTFLPYRTVHCKLSGIKIDEFAGHPKMAETYLFALANEEKLGGSPIKNLNMNSYEILLYDCEESNMIAVKDRQLVNKKLIESNYAQYDPVTKHKLDISLDFDPEEWAKNDLIWEKCENDEAVEKAYNQVKGKILSLPARISENKLNYKTDSSSDIDSNNNKKENFNCFIDHLKETKKLCTKFEPVSRTSKSTKIKTVNISSNSEISSTEENAAMSDENETSSTDINDNSLQQLLPKSTCKHKRPFTTWYETDSTLYFSINAPDIDDYNLRVTKESLNFSAIVNGEQHVLTLHFFGFIEPKHTFHEIRGLRVVVRLQKSVPVTWPRLLRTAHKLPWLKYNLEAINKEEEHTDETSNLMKLKNPTICQGGYNEYDDGFNASEFTTNNPIAPDSGDFEFS